jgi:hypothetical protein
MMAPMIGATQNNHSCSIAAPPTNNAGLTRVRQAGAQAHALARDVGWLAQRLSHDILALAGPVLATRQELYDFVVDELRRRDFLDPRPRRATVRCWRISTCGSANTQLLHAAAPSWHPITRSLGSSSRAGTIQAATGVVSTGPAIRSYSSSKARTVSISLNMRTSRILSQGTNVLPNCG